MAFVKMVNPKNDGWVKDEVYATRMGFEGNIYVKDRAVIAKTVNRHRDTEYKIYVLRPEYIGGITKDLFIEASHLGWEEMVKRFDTLVWDRKSGDNPFLGFETMHKDSYTFDSLKRAKETGEHLIRNGYTLVTEVPYQQKKELAMRLYCAVEELKKLERTFYDIANTEVGLWPERRSSSVIDPRSVAARFANSFSKNHATSHVANVYHYNDLDRLVEEYKL